jgi:hypothetical protein
VHGPPLTPQEAVVSVAQRVLRREAQGLNREQAIRRTAVETGLDPEKVRWCAGTAFRESLIRLSPSGRRRRGALAIAAVL